ncbi:hypothetical protein ALC57_04980 [Trachymyrmex cornetzi]|uniref:Uncharacterized protein n=1 Tax=Trachymyrmex cornetzi TaxID=471704 RepID=A0A151JCD2_9HYME|nr:hypothetical protein ALC57_04980 [Trachymyrmex cornetzi]
MIIQNHVIIINTYMNFDGPNEMIKILYTRKLLDVIILREKNENIVMFNANFYDMFSTCGIPPGVINLLSHENTSTPEPKLCLEDYTTYANKYFLKGILIGTYVVPFTRLSIPKRIIIPCR